MHTYVRMYVYVCECACVCVCMYVCFCFATIKTQNEQMHIWRCMVPHMKSYIALISGKENCLQMDLDQL